MEEPKNNYAVIVGVIVLVIAIAVFGAFKYLKRDESLTELTPVIPQEIKDDAPITSIYKDEIYSAVGNYFSPGGAEQIKITLTFKGDTIIDAQAEPQATRPNSIKFQSIFTSNFKQFVVGKKIDEVVLDKVSGSSLTPKGFNDALAKIKVQAKV